MENEVITFAYPPMLPVGLLLCILAYLLIAAAHRRNYRSLQAFTGDQLLPRLLQGFSRRRRILKNTLLLSASLCLFIALSRPQWGFEWSEVHRKGIDILFALDTSKSMLATDVSPNRLERAKFALTDFINRLEGDRVGLIPFAGTAYLMVPLTLDYDIVLESLNEIDAGIIPKPGTNIAAVIRESTRAFRFGNGEKVLILLSDGEELEESAIDAAKSAAAEGVRIYTVGIGSRDGELIPLRDKSGNTSFLKDHSGNAVKSRLDEKTLIKIAESTSSSYFPLGPAGEGLDRVYQDKLKLLPRTEQNQRLSRIPLERFEWFLLAALVLLMLEFGLGDRPSGRSIPIRAVLSTGRRLFNRNMAIFLLTLLNLSACGPSPDRAYEGSEFDEAIRGYDQLLEKDPENPELHYNLGASKYRKGDHLEASVEFESALKGGNLSLQEKTYYNLGNSFYRAGEKTSTSDARMTVQFWQNALRNYESVLKLNQNNQDAAFNHAFVKKKLDELLKDGPQPAPSPGSSEGGQNRQENRSQSPDTGSETSPPDRFSDTSGTDGQTDNYPTPAPAPTPESGLRRETKSSQDMTPEEAVQLLNSLRDEEQRIVPDNRTTADSDDDSVKRDW